MPPFLPPGTTWLDLGTLGVALLALYLTVRRDRRAEEVKVNISTFLNERPLRYSSGERDLGVRLSNGARRTVTVERAGLATAKERGVEFDGFRQVNHRQSEGGWMTLSDPPLPKMLEPGEPAYIVNAPLHAVRRAFFHDPPRWVWAEDTDGNVYWASISDDVRDAIGRTKRRRSVETASGGFTEVEMEDDEENV